VFFAGDLIWTGVTTIVQQGNNQLSGAAFFVIQPDFSNGHVRAHIDNQGYVTIANNNVLYPAIAVNQDGKAVITFTVSGPDFFPSAAYARLKEDSGVGKVHIIAVGAFPDDGFTMYPPFSSGVGRWGDYSAATVDDNGNLWFATEYIPATLSGFPQGLGVNFGTFIGALNLADHDED